MTPSNLEPVDLLIGIAANLVGCVPVWQTPVDPAIPRTVSVTRGDGETVTVTIGARATYTEIVRALHAAHTIPQEPV
jgi:hypothetical protein